MATITAQIRGNAAHIASRLRLRLAAGRAHDHGQIAAANPGRLALWTPVLFASGIGGYFALPAEPAFWLGGSVFFGAGLGAIWFRKQRGAAFFAVLAIMIAAAGFAVAQVRTAAVSGPVLEREIGPVSLSGRVIRVEPSQNRHRITIDGVSTRNTHLKDLPERVRISVRSPDDPPNPGDRIGILAILQPPPSPSLPGGYDFARKAWFERIGAVGFALGSVRATDPPVSWSWRIALAQLRLDITRRILAGLGTEEVIGPVAAALMTGERRAIPETALTAMRDSGLAHLLAISGLHIGLVAGLLFFAVRFGLALIEPLALRYPIKKYAAFTAILGAFAYLMISGATIPTQRAFLMVAIVMFAVMIDRTAISMRLVALSAMAVLLFAPESLLSASFQMSFAAVVGLVAVYEAAAPRMTAMRHRGGLLGSRIGLFVAATLLTTLVASFATAPFAIYHFNRIALYGLLANMVAVPVMAMWIMPFGIVSFLLMPVGLEFLGLAPMGWGISVVLWIADSVAGLPGSVALVPSMTTTGLAVLSVGGVWLCVIRGRIRFYGLPVVAAGLASLLTVTAPDILVNRDGDLVAVNLGGSRVVMSPGGNNSFERDMWQRHLAVDAARNWPAGGVGPVAGIGCDATGCIAMIGERSVALVSDVDAAIEDCGIVDYVILLTRIPRRVCGDRPWSRVSEKRRRYLD